MHRPTAIKNSDLHFSIWASRDELRGGMDASQNKDVVIPNGVIRAAHENAG